jgi:hypothetical protein
MPNKMNNFFEETIKKFIPYLSYPIAGMDDVVWYWDDRMDKVGIQGRYKNVAFWTWFEPVYKSVLASSGKIMPKFMMGTCGHERRHAKIAHGWGIILFTLTRLPGLMFIQHKYMGVWQVEYEINCLMGDPELNPAILKHVDRTREKELVDVGRKL